MCMSHLLDTRKKQISIRKLLNVSVDEEKKMGGSDVRNISCGRESEGFFNMEI